MRMMIALNKGIVFLLEMIMIGSFARFGFQKGGNLFVKWLLAAALPAIAILLWSSFAAPKSSHRLSMPYLAFFRALMFLAAACGMYTCNKSNMAISVATAVLAITTQSLSYHYGD